MTSVAGAPQDDAGKLRAPHRTRREDRAGRGVAPHRRFGREVVQYGGRAREAFLRLDGMDHVPDLSIISLYDPVFEEAAAFEELIGAHGGLGGPQAEPFILHPAEWTIDAPIAADRLAAGRHRVDRRGRPARTEIEVLRARSGLALVACRLLTGRTHQVRVHLAHAGMPVAGDALYGGGQGVPRPFLHAWRLKIPHPDSGARLELEAPIPADMTAFLAARGLADVAD